MQQVTCKKIDFSLHTQGGGKVSTLSVKIDKCGQFARQSQSLVDCGYLNRCVVDLTISLIYSRLFETNEQQTYRRSSFYVWVDERYTWTR